MSNSQIPGNRIIDPRNIQPKGSLKLAERKNLDALKAGPVLFYNNTKLDFCNYGESFRRIKELFSERGITSYVNFKETVRGKTSQMLREYAQMMAKTNPVAAVVALGDMGTTPATTVVSIELERLGIPTVYLTASPGAELAEAVAHYRAGNLCLCQIDIYQGSTVEEVSNEIDQRIEDIIDSLSCNGEKLAELSKIDFPLDREPSGQDALLDLFENDNLQEVQEYFDKHRLSDGLPIVPPTFKRYQQMLEYCPFSPEETIIADVGPTGQDVTVKDIVVAAVMAGCKPAHVPVLITAFKALGNKKYNFLQSVTTSHPGGNMILVSGPLAKELEIHGGSGCLGPGFPANATIGRAVNLVLINVCRSVPGVCDLDCLASQAEFTYCFAEDENLAVYDTINREHFDADTTAVMVLKAEPPHDIIDFLSQTGEDLLDTLLDCATTLGSNNAYIPGPMIFVLTPDHGKLLKKSGITKEQVQRFIHTHAHHPVPMVNNRGLVPVRPKDFANRHPMPVTRSPKDIEVVIAGNRGGHSAVILPWALHSEAIIEPVALPDGKPAKKICEFKSAK